MRYLRLFSMFMRSSLQMELEYRANFIVQSAQAIFWGIATIISATVLFGHTDDIGGWRFDELLLIIGLHHFVLGFVEMLLFPNVRKIVEMIQLGTMDFVLLKPVNSQFLSSLRYMRTQGVTELLVGIAIFGYAMIKTGSAARIDAATLAAFIFLTLMALLIVYSIWVLMASVSFWFVKVNELSELFFSLFETSRFPVTAFQGLVRAGLTFVVPIAFVTTFPAEVILRPVPAATMITAALLAGGLFAGSALFWRTAVRSYSSASS